MIEILWLHPDIPPAHLEFVRSVTLVESRPPGGCRGGDNIYSFYDPTDGHIKIRRDQADNLGRFEMVFLVALGQSGARQLRRGQADDGVARQAKTVSVGCTGCGSGTGRP